jgi:putative copper export protein
MISPTLDSFRIFLHLLAAAVWVGGQIVLGGLVPKLRKSHPEALTTTAQGFARVAWPAFAVLVVTGFWNIFDTDITALDTSYQVTLGIKIILVAVGAIATVAHSASPDKRVKAIGGAVGLLSSLVIFYLGILLSSAV